MGSDLAIWQHSCDLDRCPALPPVYLRELGILSKNLAFGLPLHGSELWD